MKRLIPILFLLFLPTAVMTKDSGGFLPVCWCLCIDDNAGSFLPPPDIGALWTYGSWLIVALLAGIGMLFRKAFGWYLYFAIIAVLAIVFLLSAILFISNVGIIGEGAMAGGDVFGELLPSILLFTFLVHQMLYWGNRSTRQNASESLTI